MAGEDFDQDPQQALPKGPQGVSQDMSQQSGLRKAWDSWTSRPENNAALINFGLNLMQPIQPGQTRLGHFAESIGQGAEGLQRNVAAQEERQHYEEAQAQKEEALDIKRQEAAAYAKLAESRGAPGAGSLMNARYRAGVAENKAFSTWLTGEGGKYMLEDNLWANVKKRFPQLKDKGDLMNDPAALKFARQLHHQTYAPEGDEGAPAGGGDTVDQAIAWARANPQDPRAAAVLKKAGRPAGGATEE